MKVYFPTSIGKIFFLTKFWETFKLSHPIIMKGVGEGGGGGAEIMVAFHVLREGTPVKRCKVQLPLLFISCCFTSVFTVAIILYDFLEFHSTFIWKKICASNFSFLTDLPKAPTVSTLNSQNPLSMMKVFRWCSLNTLEVI